MNITEGNNKLLIYCKNDIVIEVNEEFIDLTGYLEEEIIGNSLYEISKLLRIDSQINLQNLKYNGNYYMFTKSLQAVEVVISYKDFEESNEKEILFEVNFCSSMNEKFEFAGQLYTDKKTAVAISSFSSSILLNANQNYVNYLQEPYNRIENCIGKKLNIILEGFGYSKIQHLIIENTKKPLYYEEVQHNSLKRGVTYWNITLVPIFIEERLKYIIQVILDVTEKVLNRKLIEKQSVLICNATGEKLLSQENLLIRAQYESLRKIIENLELGFIRCSYPDFKIIDINYKAYKAFTQKEPKEGYLLAIKGKRVSEVSKIDETDRLIRIIQNRFENKMGMFMYISQIGVEKFVQSIFQPIFGLDGQVLEIVVVSVNISDEIRSKNKMEEALQMQKELFANISHELKTPLTIISSANQLIESYLDNNLDEDKTEKIKEKVAEKTEMIKENTNRMKKLVSNILDLSKIESGFTKLQLSNENIVEIVENIVQSIPENMKGKKLSVIFDTNTEEKIIAIDLDNMERVILNLISNAIKFSDSGNEIDVTVLDKDKFVEISVKDNGIGIDKKYFDSIFERFHQVDRSFTRNAEGSGIGLSLVKSIVEMHDGKISVESEIGKGSTFTIELPVKLVKKKETAEKGLHSINISEMVNFELSDIY